PGAPAAPQQGNGLAVASMVLGILAIVFFWLGPLCWILAVLAIIFGAIGIGKANKVGKGKGMAIAGLACGLLGVLISVAVIFLFFSAAKDVDKELRRMEKENRQQMEKDLNKDLKEAQPTTNP
ncbi:MAG TPA: DUF4190 domain-containing protein, partial [Kofleriaceae bacterium]|nr:DUF4190 domain-containing protein [Kofleriaceae bacterium]